MIDASIFDAFGIVLIVGVVLRKLFSIMETATDSLYEEGTFLEYQSFENNTWSSLTISIPSSSNRAKENPSKPSGFRRPNVPAALMISTSLVGYVAAGHRRLVGIVLGGVEAEAS